MRRSCVLLSMKQLAILILIMGYCSCRTIQGEYYESFGAGWGGATYHFHRNGTFEYKSQYDVGGEYGSGRYKIRAGHLLLMFTDSYPEAYTSATYCLYDRDSLDTTRNFTLILVDENREPLPFGIVQYSTDKDTSKIGFTLDIDGNFQLHLADSVDTLSVKVRYPGYDLFQKSMEVGKYDSIKIQMIPNPNWMLTPVDSGTVWKYGYKKVDSKTIRLTERRVDEELTNDYRIKRTRRKLIKTLVKQ